MERELEVFGVLDISVVKASLVAAQIDRVVVECEKQGVCERSEQDWAVGQVSGCGP